MYLAKAIDNYIASRKILIEDPNSNPIDKKIESVVEKMFKRCFDDKEFKQVFLIYKV
jgi:26S proteasome regulatory subunit N2